MNQRNRGSCNICIVLDFLHCIKQLNETLEIMDRKPLFETILTMVRLT